MIYILILAIWIIIGIISLYKCTQHLEVTRIDYWLIYVVLIISLLKIILKV